MLYCVGDIHGHKDQLDIALERIEADGGPMASVVFLGDYIDRGPESRSVVQTLFDGIAEGRDWVALKGNHDRYLVDFIADPTYRDPKMRAGYTWFDQRIGGNATLASYGVDMSNSRPLEDIHAEACAKVPEAHIAFIKGLPTLHVTEDLICAHAGLRPGVALDNQDEEDLLWIREEFHDDPRDYGRLVVHGHTALEAPQHFGNRVDLDGGAGFGRPLTAAVFDGRDCWVLTDAGREPLTP